MIWKKIPIETIKERCLNQNLELVDQYIDTNNKARFKCPFCGTLFTTHVRTAIIGRVKSCGCKKFLGNENKHWKGVGEFGSHKFSAIKQSAVRKNLEFNITKEDIWNLFCIQNKLCSYTGVDISFKDKTASIDRIDNTKGYIIDNITMCHRVVNFMKSDIELTRFQELCSLITQPIKIENKEYNIIFTKNRQDGGYGNITKGLYNYLISCATVRDLEFELTPKELWNLYINQHGKCNITGLPINFPFRHKDYRSASLDRIDNNLGYVLGNIHWVHRDVNKIKHTMLLNDLKYWAELVYRKSV